MDLKAQILEHSKTVDVIRITSDMHPSVRAGIATQLDGIAAEADRTMAPAVRDSADAALRDDLARLYRSMAMLNSWLEGREQQSRDWIDRAAEFAASDVLRDLVLADQHRLRDGEAFAGIRALCQQGLVDKARRELIRRRKATRDQVMRKRIDEVLADPRNFLAPLKGAPSMFTLNGFGTMLWGERDKKPDGTYVATLCLVFLFLPLIPFKSYLVSRSTQGWRFYGTVPLSPFAFWWRRLAILGPLLFGLGTWAVDAYANSPSVKEERALTQAAEQVSRRDYGAALRSLKPLAWSSDKARIARMKQLWDTALLAALNDIQTPSQGGHFLTTGGALARELNRPLEPQQAAAVDAALTRLAPQAGAGRTILDLISWRVPLSPELAGKQPDLAAQACATHDDPQMLAATADLFAAAKRPCPPDLLVRLKAHLLKNRHSTWNADAVSYLRSAPASDARPVMLARLESAWKAAASAQELVGLPGVPEPFRKLAAADAERSAEKRAGILESAVENAGLQEPEKGWHQLGLARRMAKVYGELNERDPVRWPIAKAHPWAVQAAELVPDDDAARLTALRYLIQDGDFARAIAMGTPALRDEKTALLVGMALARSGKPEEGSKILRPIVDRDLEAYVTGMKEWMEASETKTTNTWRSLEKGTAPQAIIKSLNSLHGDQAQAQADAWVRAEVARDPYVASLSAKVKKLGDIHSAATELAMIELELGQSLPKGAARQARLEAAEHLFVQLRKILSNDPYQELQLGQVYFWLGKDKEGTEIFDALEKTADGPLLHRMGEIYRNLAHFGAARRILELAYTKTTGKAQMDIALTRALSGFTHEDRLAWLKKADTSNARVKADLDQTEAEVDLEAGNYAEATGALKRAAAYYASIPDQDMSLNNASIIQLHLAKATGDLKYQMEALRMLRLAHEAAPEDAIVLNNYVSDLQHAGIAALAGTALRADLLHEIPTRRWMDFLDPRPSPEVMASKAKTQAELRRAAELGARSTVLSPDAQTGYTAQTYFLYLTRDGAGMRKLREQVESRPARHRQDDAAEEIRAPGQKEASQKKAVERGLARWEQLLPGLRKAGHAPTLAYALMDSAAIRFAAFRYKVEKQTIDLALRDANEAVALQDNYSTRHTLAWIRTQQAAALFAEKDPAYALWTKETPYEDDTLLLFCYLRKNPARLAAFRQLEEGLRATRDVADLVRKYPERHSIRIWAWLEMMGDATKEASLKALRESPTSMDDYILDWLLNPGSFGDSVDAWLAAEATGNADLAARIAAGMREHKLLPLYFKE